MVKELGTMDQNPTLQTPTRWDKHVMTVIAEHTIPMNQLTRLLSLQVISMTREIQFLLVTLLWRVAVHLSRQRSGVGAVALVTLLISTSQVTLLALTGNSWLPSSVPVVGSKQSGKHSMFLKVPISLSASTSVTMDLQALARVEVMMTTMS
jgi:hypothetical protein